MHICKDREPHYQLKYLTSSNINGEVRWMIGDVDHDDFLTGIQAFVIDVEYCPFCGTKLPNV